MQNGNQGAHLRALFAGLLAAAAVFAVTADARGLPATRPGSTQAGAKSLLVKFSSPAGGNAAVRAEGDTNLGSTRSRVTVVGIEADESVVAKLAEYRSRPDVVYAEPNYVASAFELVPPDDPSFGTQWALAKIQAVGGWSLFPGTYGIAGGATIGIIDTGADLTHPDLVQQLDVADSANCIGDESGTCVQGSALDDQGHGTHTTGIAAAATNDGIGVAGVAVSTPVIPVKVLDSYGSGSYAGVANGILWAAQHGARVISLSLGGSGYSQTLCDSVATATNTYGALVVAAAGNDGSSERTYPASCPGAIGVGATGGRDQRPQWSNFGRDDLFISAPGVAILSTYPGGTYETLSGTSMATPFVAGLASLLFGQDSTRTPEDVKTILAATADKVGNVRYRPASFGACAACTYNPYYGYGRINVRRALGGPDLSLGATPDSRKVKPGKKASFMLVVSETRGFAGQVTLTPSGLPRGWTWSLDPDEAGQVSMLRIAVPRSASRGTRSFSVTASGDGLTRSVNLSLQVTR